MLNWTIRSSYKPQYTEKDLAQATKAYQTTIHSPETGFFHLPENKVLIQETQNVFEKFKHKKVFVHIGIGGSALGPEMLLSALGKDNDIKFVFINNIDPDELHKSLAKINIKDALIYVVSKSGTTAETVAAMSIMINMLEERGIKADEFKNYFVFCTDPEKGDLRKLARDWNVQTLSVPSNIGGRFSVLTSVGFLPVFFAGIKPQDILNGAMGIQPKLAEDPEVKAFYELGLWIKDLHDQGVHQTVMMPYSSRLKNFSAWFVQLWAESLGKDGKGLTPIPAYGATDQHSQMQLFMEGPKDKIMFVIEVEKFQHDFALKNNIATDSFKLLSPFRLSELMKAELEGTLSALSENGRHVVHLKIPELNEASLGQLILFSESLTALVGRALNVDPFNQPGVEAGKKYANSWLKSQGK